MIKTKIKENQLKINKEIYSYFIGESGVVIHNPDGSRKLVDLKVIKGHYNPKKFQKILDKGEPYSLKSKEIKKYIEDKLND